ncbi:MAG: universal stress protein [Nitrospirota bacterium]
MPTGAAKPYDIKTILVPTDFSEGAQLALEYAKTLAKVFKAKIVLLHVIETLASTLTETMQRVGTDSMVRSMTQSPQLLDVYALIQRAVEPALDQVVEDLKKDGVSSSRSLLQGPAYEQIVAQGRALGADLIVMGTHGRRGVSHLFMGSVAERVVRLASCPVLTVRTPHGPAGAPT